MLTIGLWWSLEYGRIMATAEPDEQNRSDRTTIQVDGQTAEAASKLQNQGETLGDVVREGLKRLVTAEPERLELDFGDDEDGDGTHE